MSDFGGFGAILKEAKALADEEKQHVSPACPVCGTILDVRPRDGMRNCPLGHYRDNGVPHVGQ